MIQTTAGSEPDGALAEAEKDLDQIEALFAFRLPGAAEASVSSRSRQYAGSFAPPIQRSRLELEIGEPLSGKAPKEVLDAALASLGTHHVDATDIKVIDRTPLILVRFTVPASSEAEEDTAAQVAARRPCEAVERLASTGFYGAVMVLGCQSADWIAAASN